VLVGESAGNLSAVDPVPGEVDGLWWLGLGVSWCELAEGAVRPGSVVVPRVFGQRLPKVVLVDDQHPVEEFPARGAGDLLADRVRCGRPRRAGQDADALGREHGVERAGELACAIPDQELS
jgi:hypothetical protein